MMLKARISLVAVLAAAATGVNAQERPITASPPNIIVPNYDGIPTGPLGGRPRLPST
jgi:hypothetical protein